MRRFVIVANLRKSPPLAAGCGSSSSRLQFELRVRDVRQLGAVTSSSPRRAVGLRRSRPRRATSPTARSSSRSTGPPSRCSNPEGWVAAQHRVGPPRSRTRNNLVRIVVRPRGRRRARPRVSQELQRPEANDAVAAGGARAELGHGRRGRQAVKVSYSTQSAANPRHWKSASCSWSTAMSFPGTGRYAIVDLGTPKGRRQRRCVTR